MKNTIFFCAVVFALSGCGGGGDPIAHADSTVASTTTTSLSPLSTAPSAPVTDVPLSSLANICTPDAEKTWLRAYLDDAYLWYRDIVNLVSENYATPQDYFYALLVKSKDRFSFAVDQTTIDNFFQAGEDLGYGAYFVRDSAGILRISHVEPDSPASSSNLGRGAQIIAINGTPEGALSSSAFRQALNPSASGETNTFEIRDEGASVSRIVSLRAQSVATVPVPQAKVITAADSKKIGYLVFDDHIATAESQLTAALAGFSQAGIDDLVLDVRYNGGGYLYIAQELSSMIGGAAVQGRLFETLQHNDKHPERDSNYQFKTTDSNYQPLPLLNLHRVFVLTSAQTCSASESIINALQPFLQVITVGATTCGKPYAFEQANNCSVAYLAISSQGKNSVGQSVPDAGIAPTCSAEDDLDHALGDVNERLLAAALNYRISGTCNAVSFKPSGLHQFSSAGRRSFLHGAAWRSGKIVR